MNIYNTKCINVMYIHKTKYTCKYIRVVITFYKIRYGLVETKVGLDKVIICVNLQDMYVNVRNFT